MRHNPFTCLLISLATLALAVNPAAAQATKESTGFFTASGKNIPVERFEPHHPGTYPAIVMVHGADGIKKYGFVYRMAAQVLAKEGYVVLLVHYFERTGIDQIAPQDIKEEFFATCMDTVRQGIAYARRQPGVDSRRIGLVGFSLGAFLSLSVARNHEEPIAAVVDWFGGMPSKLREDCKTLPPTLIVHGAKDSIVSVQEALALEKLLLANNLPHEIKVYKSQDHLFMKDPFGADLEDAKKITLTFLDKHLKNTLQARMIRRSPSRDRNSLNGLPGHAAADLEMERQRKK